MGKIISQISHLGRQQPRLRKEIILQGKRLMHIHQVPGQVMLLGDALNARIHIDFLVRKQLREETCCYC
jgi:hypothetical protein